MVKWGSRISFLGLILWVCTQGFSQAGPAGVGSSTNNALWLKANSGTSTTTNGAPVVSWIDASGNANHVSQSVAAQRPTYTSSLMNGYPAILFDNVNTVNQNDCFVGADNSNLDNTNGLTIFTVTRMNSLGNAQSIIAKRTNVGVNQAYMFFYYTSNYMTVDVASNDNRFSTSPVAYSINTNYILDLQYDGTQASTSRVKVYNGEELVKTAAESSSSIIDYASPLLIGTTHVGDNRAFAGYIAEIILYRVALGAAQRIIINNYLSAKYDIALAANDIYKMDEGAFGNFDHDVAGIGRESATDLNTDAQGPAIVRILNPSNLDDDEYMTWGHNNGTQTAINSTDIPSPVEARFDRVWRVSQSNKAGVAVSVGTVEMRWDLSAQGPVTESDLRLLIDTDNDGIFGDETPIGGAVNLGGGVYQFTGVIVPDQVRFTLGTINVTQTPLPVELVDFTAEKNDQRSVMLQWKTKSELNSDYFVVEHSTDGLNWNDKFKVQGAGNSSETINYQLLDETPAMNANYYRLRQVDFNGDFEYSEMRYVNFSAQQMSAYPNPADGRITITGISGGAEFIRVRNMLGQLIESVTMTQTGTDKLDLDISSLPAGVYFVETSFGSIRFIKN